MRKFIFTTPFLFSLIFIKAQVSDFKVYKPQSAGAFSLQNMLQNLIGDGVVLKNFSVSKTWSNEAFGSFEDGKSRLGMKKGLIMTTGGITALCGKNTKPNMSNYTHETTDPNRRSLSTTSSAYTSPDLEKLLGNKQKTFDAVVIEMDIVPTADSLSFNYVFGSEEYDEFVGSSYNDAFAFFISGKGVEGQVNMAVVPGTKDAVSVNSINNGSASYRSRASHPTYYISNIDGNLGIEYDGLTRLMEIKQAVTPYETYHLKLAIADVGDNAYDSGVLIEGHSIVSYEKSYSVLYNKNESAIDEPYKNLLNALVKEYKTKTDAKISITGHTDSEGELNLNQELSCQRAGEVKDYLLAKGVPENRLVISCKGETMPAHDNNSEEGKHMNRRVELKLLGTDKKYNEDKKSELLAEEKSKVINNVPNPFSGNTTLNAFVLNEVKEARIEVKDITGKQIKTIYLLERGNASVSLSAHGFPAGIYLATLIADGKAEGSIKMIHQQ